MKISFDTDKRAKTLFERGLDFTDAIFVFENIIFEYQDLRHDYGEKRMICYGILNERVVVIGYVERSNTRHIFTMRRAHEKETRKIWKQLH